MLVLESSESAPTSFKAVYCWYGHTDPPNGHSLLKLVEENDERLRDKYLRWVSDVGESRHKGRRLTEWTALTESFSYWWMTLIAERSVWKTPAIIDALRLFALEEEIAANPPDRLILVSPDPQLRSSIQRLCDSYQVPFQWKMPLGSRGSSSTRPGRSRHIHPVFAALAMFARYTYRCWKLRLVTPANFVGHENSVMFATPTQYPTRPVDYDRRPHSILWPNLQTLLRGEDIPNNWLETHSPSGRSPRLSHWVQQLRQYDEHSSRDEVHVVLNSFLSTQVLLRVIVAYLKLVLVFLRLGSRRVPSNLANRPWLWPLHANAWKQSMIGHVAVENLFWFVLFDKALEGISPQRRGFYLSEGQSWEAAFVNAWQRHGLGELVAVPHSTIRFWDLRYYPDIGVSSERDTFPRPAADFVAVNGPLSRAALNGPLIPPRPTVECEALRYQHLGSADRWTPSSQASGQPLRVLLVADYLSEFNEAMIRVAGQAAPLLGPGTQFAIKRQPHGTIADSLLEQFQMDVHEEPISQLVHDYDVALVSGGTSAIVDLYVLGIPVVVFQHENNLDFSPLKGFAELPTVGTASELAQALGDAATMSTSPVRASDLLFLDLSLDRWRKLVGAPLGN
ncbi:MAG: hypothetical protein CL471_01410 [Acidobacteria bacterium]|nr:hypothetical protein [Acidobacteriota bacterium]